MDHKLTPDYWNERYRQGYVGWDLGAVSHPMKVIIDRLEDRSIKILVPGAGNGFEVSYLWQRGFSNVHILDWAESPLQQFAERNPEFPEDQMIQKDFFQLNGQFDLILEQTFFCALNPSLRSSYVSKMYDLLNSGGRIQGVLFDAPMLIDRPPFGGNEEEYRGLFEPYFEIEYLRRPQRSEPERVELEFSFLKK